MTIFSQVAQILGDFLGHLGKHNLLTKTAVAIIWAIFE